MRKKRQREDWQRAAGVRRVPPQDPTPFALSAGYRYPRDTDTPRKLERNVRVAGQGTTCIHPITKGAEPAPDATLPVVSSTHVQRMNPIDNLEPAAQPPS